MKKLLVAWIVFGFGLAVHAAEKQYVIGMSQCNLGEPWRVQMNTDVKNAAEKHSNIKMIFKDAQNDSLKQRAQIEEFVNSKVDLIIVSPKEAAPLTPPVAACSARTTRASSARTTRRSGGPPASGWWPNWAARATSSSSRAS